MKTSLLAAVCVLCASCGSGPAGPAVGSSGSSGIDGIVVVGPTCPVEIAGSPCPDRPVSTDLLIVDSHGKTVAQIRSEADGSFHADVPPGRYTIEDADRRPPTGPPSEVEVEPSQRARTRLAWDSGIR